MCEVEDEAFISGGVVVHQFSKIGRLAMIGGNTRVNSDAPPFFLYAGHDIVAKGLNLVGLKRAGFKASQVAPIKQAYRLLYRSGLKLEDALARIESEIAHPGDAPPGGVHPPQQQRHLPGVERAQSAHYPQTARQILRMDLWQILCHDYLA